ncbi:hypothetical protein IEN91_04850 [Bacillus velezensis]|uniref:hypothetical protein n=1 Tax=Bacillus velezensis TaxID=492670 RepID=UPI0018C4B91D|nr:hypothetical protein [Bacillus velezensis]QPK89773.1 hypothetical protein IEN91_04850 [Bacillus velezensis]
MISRYDNIDLKLTGSNCYEIKNRAGQTLLEDTEDYFIYIRSAVFKEDGVIQGMYLGEYDENYSDEFTKEVVYRDNEWVTKNNKKIESARMVAVDNKNKTIIVISND